MAKYTFINSATDTICESIPATLHRIVVTGGTAGAITIWDNATEASGDKIAEFDSTNDLAHYDFEVEAKKGIVVETGAATNVTVVTSPQGSF